MSNPRADYLCPSLAHHAMTNLRRHFATKTTHRPSEPMYEALGDMLRVMEEMAEGECRPQYYLSPLDCGVGKTSAIVEFVRVLLGSPRHSDVSVLLCIARLDEMKQLADKMGLSEDDYAVYTSDNDCNDLGKGKDDADNARVLFTTQAMIERRCDGRPFGSVQAFHYRGQPREVRIWDEAMLPGQPVTLTSDRIASLYEPLRRRFPDFVDTLEALAGALKEAPDGAVLQVPDFEVDTKALLAALGDDSREYERVTAAALGLLSGKSCSVCRNGKFGNHALSYRETLPEGFAPLLITDASGRVRTTYQQWKDVRGGLVVLKEAQKTYNDLTVHVWSKGGGKSAFENDKRGQLVNGIASIINSKPDEEWLVVHHKAGGRVQIEENVSSQVTGNTDRVHFVNWGRHQATNEFVNVPNVILAGTLFYPPSYYEAMARMGSEIAADTSLSKALLNRVTIGEHRHLILQALCRGTVRQSVGGDCPPCHAYIIASPRSGIKEALPDVFPGCTVTDWQPSKRALRGKMQTAARFVIDHLEEHSEDLLSFAEVRAAVGINDRRNFNKRIRGNAGFVDALAEHGIIEHGNGECPTGFMKEGATFGFLEEAA